MKVDAIMTVSLEKSNHHTIDLMLNPNTHRAQTYGIPFVSKTEHKVFGPGVHNPSFPHVLDVWINPLAPAGSCAERTDPNGQPTDETYSFLLSARAVAITSHRQEKTQETGVSLQVGDTVTLTVEGLPLAYTYRVEAGHLSDPHLVRI